MIRTIAILVAVQLLLTVSNGLAAGIERYSLVGLSRLAVAVEPIADIRLSTLGISEDAIKRDVELRLRQNGIAVGDSAEAIMSVVVQTVWYESLCVFYVSTRLYQPVSLLRDPSNTLFAATWNDGSGGLYGESGLSELEEVVLNLVDRFLDDYLAANQDDRISQNKR